MISIQQKITNILGAQEDIFPNFYSKYLEIERYLHGKKLQKPFVRYFKDSSNCSFTITNDENDFVRIQFKYGDKSIELGKEKSFQEVFELCDKIDKEITNRRLYFSPEPDEGFINDIISAKRGDIYSYNNRNSFVCIDDATGNKKFCFAFHGDIKNISVNDFRNSDIFLVKDKNSHDLKYMYSLAYDYRSVSVVRKKYGFENGNGYYPVTEIERNHVTGVVTNVSFGNCKLRLVDIYNGKQNKLEWIDSDGLPVSRDIVALMLAWTKTVAADISISDDMWSPNYDEDIKIIKDINQAIIEHNVSNLTKMICQYSLQNNNLSSITFTGLLENNLSSNNYVFSPVTFSFACKEKNGFLELLVFKTEINEKGEEIYLESSEEEFYKFYEQRYSETKEITLKEFSRFNEQEKNAVFKKIVEKSSNQSILGQVTSEVSTATNSILHSYLEDKLNGNTFIAIKDIIPQEYENSVVHEKDEDIEL